MKRLLRFTKLLLVVAAWLIAALGTRYSLVTGMAPALALGVLLFWTLLAGAAYYLAVAAPRAGHWRNALPYAVFILSLVCFRYAFKFLRPDYRNAPGFPRRYYSWDTTQ